MTPILPVTDAELDELVDGRLSEQRCAEVEAWLREHPAQAAEVERLRELDRVLKSLGARLLDAPVPERLRALVRHADAGRAPAPPGEAAPSEAVSAPPPGAQPWTWPAQVGTLLLAMVAGGALGWMARGLVPAPPPAGAAARRSEPRLQAPRHGARSRGRGRARPGAEEAAAFTRRLQRP